MHFLRCVKRNIPIQRCLKRNSSNVGFVGLGNMGSRMAANLIKKGNTLKIYDIAESRMKDINNAIACKSIRECISSASIVITVLPNGEALRKAAISGSDSILKYLPKDAVFINCSTVEPELIENISRETAKQQVRFVDAPVSGGITGAEAGTLTFITGGSDEDISKAEPLLFQMGSRVMRCGKLGSGQVAKLCNNLILGATMIATAEAMNLGIKSGLDAQVLASVINSSSGRSWSSEIYNPVPGVVDSAPSTSNYEGGATTRMMAKDLACVESLAAKCEAPMIVGTAAHQIYRTMIVNGMEEKDFSSVYKFISV